MRPVGFVVGGETFMLDPDVNVWTRSDGTLMFQKPGNAEAYLDEAIDLGWLEPLED